MQEQSLLQQIADNWFFLAMFTAFLCTILWAIRPGTKSLHSETSNIPFRNEDYPGSDDAAVDTKTKEVQP